MILINYTKDIIQGTIDILTKANLQMKLDKSMIVSIKPNLVLASPSSNGATTHPEVVEGIIQYLYSCGIRKIQIIESSWVGDNTKRAFKVCGYETLSKKYNIPLYDLKDDETVVINGIECSKKAVEADFLINVPVLKAHCQTSLTCCMKNLKGCISDREKRKFHTMGLHHPIAKLNTAIKPDFHVIDGICGDLNFEEGGTPVERNMILAGTDPLLLDSYCALQIGFSYDEIEYLSIGKDLGVGQLYGADTELIEMNAEHKPVIGKVNRKVLGNLTKYVDENQACSACYSALMYALYCTHRKPKNKISVGQGFVGEQGVFGCGNCTRDVDTFIPGCPPKAIDVRRFLESLY